MYKKIYILFLLILTIALSSCGFKKLKNPSANLFYINSINTSGDVRIGYFIKNEIIVNSSKQSLNKINIVINSKKTNKVKTREVSGKAKKYTLTIEAQITVSDSNYQKIFSKNFVNSVEYDVGKKASTTLTREKRSIASSKSLIAEDISKYLNIYFNN